jgi:hypothetical protein
MVVVPYVGGGVVHRSCCWHPRRWAATPSVKYNLLPLPSSNKTSPTAPRSPWEGLSFSLHASIFFLDCTLYVCVQCDRQINESPAQKD